MDYFNNLLKLHLKALQMSFYNLNGSVRGQIGYHSK